jgi:hypothetical protein
MMLISRIWIGLKALSELGVAQVGLYGLYQLGLRSGHYQRQLSVALSHLNNLDNKNLKLHPCLPCLPETGTLMEILKDQVGKLYEQADEIVAGKIRLFGGQPVALVLNPPQPLEEWAKYEFMGGRAGDQDIKIIWEAGRFGWACTLAMAYYLSQNESYANAFWRYTDQFLASNPPYMGPHWSSAQEVAIRLVSLAFALQVFAQPGLVTEEHLENIIRSIAIHAERIPPTMVYSHSQNNNHLIAEALGLYTASALLPDHPQAARWHQLGWKWLLYAFRTQIEPDGTYTQHSTNYHRLMLQAAMWAFIVRDQCFGDDSIPAQVTERLVASLHWLWSLVDLLNGCVPNLGHNDGAYILPLTICHYADYRPVIQACARVFLRTKLAPQGIWNDMSEWLGISSLSSHVKEKKAAWLTCFAGYELPSQPPHLLANPSNGSWAFFRVAEFHSRPAHCDQLHVDLWWHDLDLALDPGTYQYNSTTPWENSLVSAVVHNTITVDGKEFMRRAGRFLYLDWAQAKVVNQASNPGQQYSITATHDGYRKLHVRHTRKLASRDDGNWEVFDRLTGSASQAHIIRLHWLLPDWEYEIFENPNKNIFPWFRVRVHSPYGWVSVNMGESAHIDNTRVSQTIQCQLIRAGTLLYGSGEANPICGWYSPTYGEKIPALACVLQVTGSLPIILLSQWIIPSES